MGFVFTLRWAARDLRQRWTQVLAVAVIISIGTGAFAALGSTAEWRRRSNDESFARLGMYDLRVRTADGVGAPAGDLRAALDRLDDPGLVQDAEERLVVGTQVDASTADRSILVPGRLVGSDLGDGGPGIAGWSVADGSGRALDAGDAGRPVVLLERNFADFYGLPPDQPVRIAGGEELDAVGIAQAPEYLIVTTDEGGFLAEANFAAVFTSLETVQQVTGRDGEVNDLVVDLAPAADVDAAADTVEEAFAGTGLGVTVTRATDEEAYRVLYDDIDSDQALWDLLAAMILAGAAIGALNLVSRMVDAQRREIGIAMALGWPRRRIAVRPLLVGAQIAVLGTVLGIAMTFVVIAALRPVLTSMIPLPVWRTPLQPTLFLQGAALGLVVPFAATAWPVWRAVRVMPVDAIGTTHVAARNGVASLLRRLRWPRSAFRRMPIGNVLRAPRRTALTMLGIGAAVAAVVVLLGLLDSFAATLDRNERELLGTEPDRLSVDLAAPAAATGEELAAVGATPSVDRVVPVLRVPGALSTPGHDDVEVLVEAFDLGNDVWTPTTAGRREPIRELDGIALARKAATDLGVDVGDTVTVTHPSRQGGRITTERTDVRVGAIHDSPFRFAAYLDTATLDGLGLAGVANAAYVVPVGGADVAQVQRALMDTPGVASVQPVAVTTQVVRDSLEEFSGILRVLQAFLGLLALLLAYNATSINVDERARERATLFAFGLPPRRVVALEMAEACIVGLAGTVLGIVVGRLLTGWVVTSTVGSTLPEVGMDAVVSGPTLLAALVVGTVVATVAPLLLLGRVRRTDIPGMLRVVE